MLSIDEIQRIQNLTEKLQNWQFSDENWEYFLFDLKSLKVEILQELGAFAFVFPIYISLLIRECYKFTPEEIYLAGRYFGFLKVNELDGFLDYIGEVHMRDDIVTLYAQVDTFYRFLYEVLEVRRHQGLIDEFTEEFRRLYGWLEQNAQRYFHLGYDFARKQQQSF